MSLDYKLERIRRWAREMGLGRAVAAEVGLTIGRPWLAVRARGHPGLIRLRTTDSDVDVFETIYVRRELEDIELVDPVCIIDGGANIGLSTACLASRYPAARVIAVEPDAENADRIAEHCRSLSNVELVRGGLWSRAGLLRIDNPGDSSWAFRCVPAVEGEPGAFNAWTVGGLLERFGAERCDLLKLDIEGAEEQLFGAEDLSWLECVDRIVVEVHGPGAQAAVDRACPPSEFERVVQGEKLDLRRRRPTAPATRLASDP